MNTYLNTQNSGLLKNSYPNKGKGPVAQMNANSPLLQSIRKRKHAVGKAQNMTGILPKLK